MIGLDLGSFTSTPAALLHLAPAGVGEVSLVYTGTGIDEDRQPVVAVRGKI